MNGDVARRTSVLTFVLALAACGDDRPDVQHTPVQVPVAYRHTGDTMAAVGSATMASVFVYDDSFADASPGSGFDGPHLFIERAHATESGYVADELAVGDYVSGVFSSRWVVTSACTGSASYANETWTIALAGGAACERWNGVFRPRPTWVDSWDDPRLTAPAAAPTVAAAAPLRLLVPPPSTPFARALAGIEAIAPAEAACPIALHAPDAEIAGGDSPGEAALRHAGEGSGEAFEVIDATSGELLPSAPESSARYQALYVRTEHQDPNAIDDTSFTAGSSRGRAFLVDTSEGRIVCVGDVEAQNGDAITGRSAREATMWLTLQLGIAEERAIALGLHDVAPAVPAE